MIKKFRRTEGKALDIIPGQDRLAFAISDHEDFYDLGHWMERGGYQGAVLLFYDFENGEVYQPFEKMRNVTYGAPVFSEGYYYFLQGDAGANRITLYKYLPGSTPRILSKPNLEPLLEAVSESFVTSGSGLSAGITSKMVLDPVISFKADELDLYNLDLIGDRIHVISQNETFRCYYPEKISFPRQPHETVCFIEDQKIYFEAFVEEGWDDENECATDDYNYYDKVVVRDFEGNQISEQKGSLYQAADGTWWIC